MTTLLHVTLYTILFPWISFGLLKLDTQPWFIIMSSVFVFLNVKKKFHVSIFLAFLLFLSAIGVGVAYREFNFLFARAILSYYAFFVILAFCYIVKRHYKFPVKALIVSNFIWLLAGALQFIFGKSILSFLVHARTTDDRGVTGLAPEPTFYGIFLFFMSWILILERKNISPFLLKLLLVLNLIFIALIAKSSMVLLFVFITALLYITFNFFSIKRVILVLVTSVILFFCAKSFGYLFEGNRVYKLIVMISDAPLFILNKDASMNERASHIYFSFKGFIDNFGLPHGFNSFAETLSIGRADSSGFFWWGQDASRVMSGVGSVLYELGWFSILYFFVVFSLMFSKFYVRNSFFYLFLFLGLFISAIPIAFPLLPIVIVLTHFYFMEEVHNEDLFYYRKHF